MRYLPVPHWYRELADFIANEYVPIEIVLWLELLCIFYKICCKVCQKESGYNTTQIFSLMLEIYISKVSQFEVFPCAAREVRYCCRCFKMVPRPATNSYSSSNNSTDNIVTYQWWLLFRIDIDVVCLCMMKRSTPEENTALFSELFWLLSLSCPFNMILNICQHLYCFISQFESDTLGISSFHFVCYIVCVLP